MQYHNRLSTIRSADKICVISEGRVQEQGPHQQLMDRAGVYALLNEAQSI